MECRQQDQITIPSQIDIETQVLDLSGNNIQVLPREVFARDGLINLQKLRLSRCRIGQIDPSAFRGLTNLVELDLSENLLTAVPIATFAGDKKDSRHRIGELHFQADCKTSAKLPKQKQKKRERDLC